MAGGRPVPAPALARRPRAVPDGFGVIGPPESGEGLVLESFDSRGVRRTYATSIEDGVWRDADGFDQRFVAEARADSFEGVFELAETPGDWRKDMRVGYRRVG